MSFSPVRLQLSRKKENITKAEAARRLHMSAMTYGRYENGDRSPSRETIRHIAREFGTSMEYLCCMTDDPSPNMILIEKEKDPEVFDMMLDLMENPGLRRRMLAYYKKIQKSLEGL